ncbi:MAG: flagellar motor protein [bacterium]|nr:flagellar motor protein [bacterium]
MVTTLIGIAIGIACIAGGHLLEGGSIASVSQLTAAVIVVGGTLGAVIAQFPAEDLKRAVRQLRLVVTEIGRPPVSLVEGIVKLARISRRHGLLALEGEAARFQDPFLTQAVQALVDGHDPVALRNMLEMAIEQDEMLREPGPRFFEAAGGYAPTLGILGAVLGLIQVMENLADPSKLGSGIAVAFVSTVYGVGTANLIFLPIAGKMKTQIEAESLRKEMILEGVCAIREGVNPLEIEKHLLHYVGAEPKSENSKGKTQRGKRR